VIEMNGTTDFGGTRRGVFVSLLVSCAEAVALGVAGGLTGSFALGAQTLANLSDVGVQVFLLIGVLSSVRPADDTHPLGYGRERFFWSFLAALSSFAGGGGLGLVGAVYAALHPSSVSHYPLAYLVLVATLALDAFALEVVLRPLRKQAAARGYSLRTLLRRTSDSASTALVVGGGTAVIGGVVALVGLGLSQLTGSPTPDTVASALISMLLLAGSVLLLHQNRELLTGRGVPLPMVREMRRVVAEQPEVVDVPDLFAVVVGPSSLIVDGDVTLADDLDVPHAEQTIMRAAAALRERWPLIDYVYLTPVPKARPRRAPSSPSGAGDVERDGASAA
jgi:cation diffusion facilitator family transporter